ADRVEAILRDPAEHAAVLEAASRVAGRTRQSRRGILNQVEQTSIIVRALRKVTGALQRRRNPDVHWSRRRRETFLMLLGEEEEDLVFVLIEYVRNVCGAADRVTDVALIQARFVDVVGRRAVAIVKPGVGVHAVVAAESIERAMKFFFTAARHG